MSVNTGQETGYAGSGPQPRALLRCLGRLRARTTLDSLLCGLVGLASYDWLPPETPGRECKQRAFFAALFLYLGHMLPLREQSRQEVRGFLETLKLALDLSPFHRDMASRLLSLGAVNGRMARAGVEHFGRLAAVEPELAELFVEVLYDAAALPVPGLEPSAEAAAHRVGFAGERLVGIERRVNHRNPEKELITPQPDAAGPGWHLFRIHPMPADLRLPGECLA